jgi:hypothetical protein
MPASILDSEAFAPTRLTPVTCLYHSIATILLTTCYQRSTYFPYHPVQSPSIPQPSSYSTPLSFFASDPLQHSQIFHRIKSVGMMFAQYGFSLIQTLFIQGAGLLILALIVIKQCRIIHRMESVGMILTQDGRSLFQTLFIQGSVLLTLTLVVLDNCRSIH